MQKMKLGTLSRPIAALAVVGVMFLSGTPTSALTVIGDSDAQNAGSTAVFVKTLQPGQHVFWAGPTVSHVDVWGTRYVEFAVRGPPSDARCEQGVSCFDYGIELAKPGGRLRVAADGPIGSEMDLAVTASDNVTTRSTWIFDGLAPPLTQEVFIDSPAAGLYMVRLYVFYAEDAEFNLRAKLEREAKPTHPSELLPDLRSEPPFDFTWESPSGSSCLPTEAADGASRCLRFYFGWQNVGSGKLEMVFDRDAPNATFFKGPIVQRIYASDGSFREQAGAGHYSYHKTHNHFHYDEFFSGELLRVVDADAGTLEHVAPVRKIGGCSHDHKMAEWKKFVQDKQGGDSGADCGSDFLGLPTQTRIALSAGWVDYYGSDIPDNYVDFGDNPDGEYIVRMVMDPLSLLQEEDETNNAGYARLRVEGANLTLLDRGRGSDPWTRTGQ